MLACGGYGMKDLNRDELEFVVFCVENVGQKLGKTGDEIYRLLTKDSSILEEYIVPNIDILHTLSKDYIVEDLVEYMQSEGVLG